MFDYKSCNFHPAVEEITEVLCHKRQSTDKAFFRVVTTYFLSKMAACLRANVDTGNWMGKIPINVYTLALSPSGYGKNTTVNFIEEHLIKDFKSTFCKDTMPYFARKHLLEIATERAVANHTAQNEELKIVTSDFNKLGSYLFTFDSATTPAVKQMRQMLLMAGIGSINLQIDEIGSNLMNSGEVLNVFLELFDKGFTKQKLTKNTDTSTRGEDLDGSTPTCMLLFGEPEALLDGGSVEDAFYNYLRTGYARRTLFGMADKNNLLDYNSKTPEEIYDDLTDPANNTIVDKWSNHFANLADPDKFDFSVSLDRDRGIQLVEYQCFCKERAKNLKQSQGIIRTELENRFFKALKLAGLFAFIDMVPEISEDHLKQAVKLVEESGDAFKKILTRDLPHMKLAKYIGESDHELTHAEILENLPFFKGSANKKDMLSLAKAWGLDHGILITSRFNDDIEFLNGKAFKETEPDKYIISYSDDWTFGYYNDIITWDNLKKLVTLNARENTPFNFCNHHFLNGDQGQGHRKAENVLLKFNLLVFDIDKGTSIDMAKNVLDEFNYLIYTTKSHTEAENHFRLIMPMAHELELSSEEFKTFMDNILTYLPIECDPMVRDIAHKWTTCESGTVYENINKKNIDVLPFVPGSRSNDIYQKKYKKLSNLGSLERWFIQRIETGNRNTYMYRYTMALVDSGKSYQEVEALVNSFNASLPNPLPEQELQSTCLASAAKHYVGDSNNGN